MPHVNCFRCSHLFLCILAIDKFYFVQIRRLRPVTQGAASTIGRTTPGGSRGRPAVAVRARRILDAEPADDTPAHREYIEPERTRLHVESRGRWRAEPSRLLLSVRVRSTLVIPEDLIFKRPCCADNSPLLALILFHPRIGYLPGVLLPTASPCSALNPTRDLIRKSFRFNSPAPRPFQLGSHSGQDLLYST